MDPWVNSLVQSPLVRSLNTVPSRMSSFAHGVKDNVPPFSRNRVVIDPPQNSVVERYDIGAQTVTNTSLVTSNTSVRYDIPMYGLLDQAYLILRVIGQSANPHFPINQPRPTAASTDFYISDSSAATASKDTRANVVSQMLAQPARSTSLNFADVIESVELRGNTKPIETLYAGSIASEVQKMPSSHRDFYYKSLAGFSLKNASTWSEYWDPAGGTYELLHKTSAATGDSTLDIDFVSANVAAPFVDFLIPLPFSTLHQLKDNFQTRFVEPLHINVNLKPMAHVHYSVNAIAAGTSAGYRMSLVCNFHNFHDVIENSIRDQNYKRGFPASVYGYNFNRSFTKLGAATNDTITLALTGKELIDECIVMIKRKNPVNPVASGYHAMSYSIPVVANMNAIAATTAIAPIPVSTLLPTFFFRLTGSGREIWSGWDFELTGPASHDFDLADGHAYGEDLTQGDYGADSVTNRDRQTFFCGISNTVVANEGITAFTASVKSYTGTVHLGFSHAMFPIKFGMQANQNFYTGGLALQTISNPTLYVTAYVDGVPVTSAFWDTYDAEVVLRHSQMIRIDSDTGIITTTLTS